MMNNHILILNNVFLNFFLVFVEAKSFSFSLLTIFHGAKNFAICEKCD
jgi:hypothetical protein